MRPFDYTEGLF